MFSVQIEKYMMHTQSALFEIIQVKHDIIKFLGKTKYVYKQDKCKTRLNFSREMFFHD